MQNEKLYTIFNCRIYAIAQPAVEMNLILLLVNIFFYGHAIQITNIGTGKKWFEIFYLICCIYEYFVVQQRIWFGHWTVNIDDNKSYFWRFDKKKSEKYFRL